MHFPENTEPFTLMVLISGVFFLILHTRQGQSGWQLTDQYEYLQCESKLETDHC